MSGQLRVLPLGVLGEIGKNMMVIESEGRIVVIDTGLRFPTTDMLGIDLVLPDFSYLRDRADDIEAIVIPPVPGFVRGRARYRGGDGAGDRRLQVRPDPGRRAARRRLAAGRAGLGGGA